MESLYEHEITQLVPISRGFIRGGAINRNNWRDFLARKECVIYARKVIHAVKEYILTLLG